MPVGAPAPEITIVACSPIWGGAEVYTLELARALAGHAHVHVAGTPGSPLLERAAAAGLPARELPIGPKLGRRTAAGNALRLPRAHRAMSAFLRSLPADGWCVLQYKWEEILWGGRALGPRVALLEHGVIPELVLRMPPARRALVAAFTRADAVLAASIPARDSIAAATGREAALLAGGVDRAAAQAAIAAREATRRELSLPADASLVAAVGRVTRDKGVLELAAALAVAGPGVHGVVVGDGAALEELRARAALDGLAGRLHVLGPRPDPLRWLAAADAAVLLSSRPEGRPLVALEAAAVGTPLVGLASPAVDALVAEGAGAVTVVADSRPETVAAALRRVTAAPRPAPVVRGWEDTAADLLAQLTSR